MFRRTIPLTYTVAFIKKLQRAISQHLSLQQALTSIIADEPKPWLKQQLLLGKSQIEQGLPFMKSFSHFFPAHLTVGNVGSGKTPNLLPLLTILDTYLSHKRELRIQLSKKLRYPLSLLLLTCGLFLFFFHILLPRYVQLFLSLNLELPGFLNTYATLFIHHQSSLLSMLYTKIFTQLSQVLAIFSWPGKLGFITLCTVTIMGMLYAAYILIRWSRTLIIRTFSSISSDVLWTLGIFVSNGYALNQAVQFIQAPSPIFSDCISRFKTRFFETASLSTSIDTAFSIPKLEKDMLSHAESSGHLSTTIQDVADWLSNHHLERMNALLSILPSILMVVIFLLILGFVSTIFLPLIQSLGSLNSF